MPQTARAWVIALVALLAAGAGVTALSAGSSVTSSTRMGIGAGVLAGYAAAAAIVVTDRGARTRLRCLVWGATVPSVVGVLNAVLVAGVAGLGTAVLSALPWVVGSGLVSACGPWLPALRLPRWVRRRRDARDPAP